MFRILRDPCIGNKIRDFWFETGKNSLLNVINRELFRAMKIKTDVRNVKGHLRLGEGEVYRDRKGCG